MIKISAMVGAPDLTQPTLAVYSGDLCAAFCKLARLGYDGVELMTRDPWSLDGTQLRRWLAGNDLAMVGLCTGHVFGEDHLGLVGPDADNCRQAMARLKRFVDFAEAFLPVGTLMNIGRARGLGYRGDAAKTLQHATEAFQELADYATQRGVRIVLEPVNSLQANYIITSQDGIDMVRRVGRPSFGLMLDVFHMNIEDVSIYDSLREAAECCWFVHLADNNRKWPGSAHLDFGQIVSVLREVGYQGFVSFEILPWPDGDGAAQSAISTLRQYIPL
jgi:sugar phosphate isomerase/epimerase